MSKKEKEKLAKYLVFQVEIDDILCFLVAEKKR
jgi:hypothetical protein